MIFSVVLTIICRVLWLETMQFLFHTVRQCPNQLCCLSGEGGEDGGKGCLCSLQALPNVGVLLDLLG